jgi:hypothetical protein
MELERVRFVLPERELAVSVVNATLAVSSTAFVQTISVKVH